MCDYNNFKNINEKNDALFFHFIILLQHTHTFYYSAHRFYFYNKMVGEEKSIVLTVVVAFLLSTVC